MVRAALGQVVFPAFYPPCRIDTTCENNTYSSEKSRGLFRVIAGSHYFAGLDDKLNSQGLPMKPADKSLPKEGYRLLPIGRPALLLYPSSIPVKAAAERETISSYNSYLSFKIRWASKTFFFPTLPIPGIQHSFSSSSSSKSPTVLISLTLSRTSHRDKRLPTSFTW